MAVSGFPFPALPTFPTPTGNILWVDKAGGSDSWPGTQVQPKQTIQAAVNAAANGTTIMIAPTGVYTDEVITTAKLGLTIRTSHPSQRPVIDGGGVNLRGVLHNSGSGNPNVYGLEIRHVKYAGIQVGANAVVWGNVVHDVGEKGIQTVDSNIQGIKFGGRGGHIKQNLIYSIGQAGEARGLLLLNTGEVLVEQNIVYGVRKEGLRMAGPNPPPGFTGNIVRNNIFAMCWIGFAGNGDFGTQWINNLVMDCQFGCNNKHHYFDATWFPGITAPLPAASDPTLTNWSRTHHNTFVRCSGASIQPSVNVPHGDFYSYQDNLMVDAGGRYLWEFPDTAVKGPNQVFDNNVYVTSGAGIRLPQQLALMKGYQATTVPSSLCATLTDLKAWTNANFGPEWPGVTGLAPYETHGQEKSMTQVAFNNLPEGDCDYTGTLTGVDLGDGYGTQVGARGLAAPAIRWNPIKAASATANFNSATAVRSLNDLQDDYYYVGAPRSSGVDITYDFGSSVTFSYFKIQPYSHQSGYNVHTFDLQTSNDGTSWTTAQSIVLNDAEGSAFHWNLDQVITTRYVRLANMTSFEYPRTDYATGLVLADFLVGTVSLADDTSTLLIDGFSPPPPDVDPPTDPEDLAASNITYAGFDFTWTPSTDDVAVDHYVYRVTGGLETGDPVSTSSTGFSFVTADIAAVTYTVFVKSVDTSVNESGEVSLDVDKPELPVPSVATAYWGMRA